MGVVVKIPACLEVSPKVHNQIQKRPKKAAYWVRRWAEINRSLCEADPEHIEPNLVQDASDYVHQWLSERNRTDQKNEGILGKGMDQPEVGAERRSRRDRRSKRWPGIKYFLFGGHRKSTRRGGDHKEFIYVDQYHPWLLVAILLVVILSISDGLFTLHLIGRGAYEVNPVMAWFLNLGTWPFMIAKFLFTCSAILIMLVFHNVYFHPLRLKVKILIPIFAAVFVGVISWQVFLNYLMK